MQLIDLPPELFELVVRKVVGFDPISLAWKLRLVCKTFDAYIVRDVCSNRTLEACQLGVGRGLDPRHSQTLCQNLAKFLHDTTIKSTAADPLLPTAIERYTSHFAALRPTPSGSQRAELKTQISQALAAAAFASNSLTSLLQVLKTGQSFCSADDFAMQMVIAAAIGVPEAISPLATKLRVWYNSALVGSPLAFAALHSDHTEFLSKCLECIKVPLDAKDPSPDELAAVLFGILKNLVAKRMPDRLQLLLAWRNQHMPPMTQANFITVLRHALDRNDLAAIEAVFTMISISKPKILKWRMIEHAMRVSPTSIHLLAQHGGFSARQPMHHETTPLNLAVSMGNVDLVKTLIELGADADGLDHAETDANYQAYTYTQPLRIAVENQHLEIATLLLQSGATIAGRIPNNEHTLLQEAWLYDDERIYELLLEAQHREELVSKNAL